MNENSQQSSEPGSLKQKTVKGVVWSSIERFSTQGISFLFGIILARLLSPSDYGLIAMTSIFFALARCFIDSGFGSALIRKKDRTQDDMSTCFFFNIIVALVCFVILFFTAPLIGKFYNQPILCPIVRVSGLSMVISAFGGVPSSIFSYKLDFKTTAKISLAGTIISGICGVTLAYSGLGVWSLVWQSFVGSLFSTIAICVAAKWRPKRTFSKKSFHYLFGYGSKITMSWLIGTVYENIYPIVIGKFYSSAQLGNYSRALGWAQLPSSNITGVLQKVTFPVLSEIQDDMDRLAHNYRRLLKLSGFIIFPLMTGLAAVAGPMVRIILTPKWEGCVLYLQIICFALMWYPIHAINLNLLEVKGRSDLFLRLEVIKKIVGVCIMCVTIPLGIEAMCWGMIVSSFFALFINTYYTGKLIHVGYLKQMKDLLPVFINSCVMSFLAYLSTTLISGDVAKFTIGIFTGMVYYVISSYFVTRSEFLDLMDIVVKKKR